MARYIPTGGPITNNPANGNRYVDVPGYMGDYGQVEVKTKVPVWAIVLGLGGIWWLTKGKKGRKRA